MVNAHYPGTDAPWSILITLNPVQMVNTPYPRQRGPVYRWDEADRLIVRNLYPYASKKDITRKLKHRTWHAIQKEASRLGVKRMISDDEY